jgi:hypothetical protein
MPSSGTFTSRVHQADDAHTVWGTVKETGAGSGAAFETRSGNTPAPDSTWSSWAAAGAGGAIQSPSGRRYIQYRATLSGTDPSLDKVELSYATDNVAPTATIGDPQVSGTTATVAFSSPDADIAGFECSLDQAAYAACTSPTAFTGLAAGAHTVYVRPIDKAGNTGSAVSKSFTIAAPAQGGGSQAGGGNSARDTVAPRVVLAVSSLRVTRRGTVAIRLGCPSTETRCTIKVSLKRGKTTLAHKTVTVGGGKAVTVKLQLSKAIRRQLTRRHSLKATAVIAATDATGNTATTKRALTIRA